MIPRTLTGTAVVGAAFALAVPAAWGSEPFRDHGDATKARSVLLSSAPIVRDNGDATAAKITLQSPERIGPGNLAVSPEVYESTMSSASKVQTYLPNVVERAAAQRIGPGNLAVSPEVYESTMSSARKVRNYPPDVIDRAVAARQRDSRTFTVDAREKALGRNFQLGDFAANNTWQTALGADTGRRNVAFGEDRTVPAPSSQEASSSSGTEIDWQQIGIGLGIGIVLMLGLGLVLKFAHIRPLAH